MYITLIVFSIMLPIGQWEGARGVWASITFVSRPLEGVAVSVCLCEGEGVCAHAAAAAPSVRPSRLLGCFRFRPPSLSLAASVLCRALLSPLSSPSRTVPLAPALPPLPLLLLLLSSALLRSASSRTLPPLASLPALSLPACVPACVHHAPPQLIPRTSPHGHVHCVHARRAHALQDPRGSLQSLARQNSPRPPPPPPSSRASLLPLRNSALLACAALPLPDPLWPSASARVFWLQSL
jgi:hypothetical protein